MPTRVGAYRTIPAATATDPSRDVGWPVGHCGQSGEASAATLPGAALSPGGLRWQRIAVLVGRHESERRSESSGQHAASGAEPERTRSAPLLNQLGAGRSAANPHPKQEAKSRDGAKTRCRWRRVAAATELV